MSFLRWCRRYVSVFSILIIAFVGYALFFQDSSIFKYMEYQRQIDILEKEKQMYIDSTEYYRRQNALLSTDIETMERVGREEYHMNRPDEDVFIMTPR